MTSTLIVAAAWPTTHALRDAALGGRTRGTATADYDAAMRLLATADATFRSDVADAVAAIDVDCDGLAAVAAAVDAYASREGAR